MFMLILALAACGHNHEATATTRVVEGTVATSVADEPQVAQADAPPADAPPADVLNPTADMSEDDMAALYAGCKTRVEGRELDGECESDADCQVAGCSGEVCVAAKDAADVMTTCEVRLCFSVLSSCGCQQGRCQWTLGASDAGAHHLIPRPQ